MHFITSNFNLIETNSAWSKLKKNDARIDTNFDNFFLSLSNEKIVRQYNSFPALIYLDDRNYKKIFKKIEHLIKTINKHDSKPFFFYFFSKKKTKISSKIIDLQIKKFKSKSNLFLEYYLNSYNNLFSNRNLLFLKFPFNIESIFLFTKIIKDKIKLINSKPYKLIILDCDNTIWGGVLDEDKDDEILYKSKNKDFYYEDFQKKIKTLKNKGFLLSICSKNNEKKVWQILKKRKMSLQKKDFISYEINWNEKAENISKIVRNLNLRFEDCIFIDDNALEIEKVNRKIKNLNTLHIKNINKVGEMMSKDNRFKKLLVSQDDLKKQKQYKLKSKFSSYIKKNKIDHNLIKKLHQKLKIYNCSVSNLKRAEELFNKTNQFNFSLNRYKGSDILSISKKKDYQLRLFDLRDKFGNHGLIGAYVLKIQYDKILVDDFILSCRVLSRFVEVYVLYIICNKFKRKKIEINYRKTNLNSNLIPLFLKKNFFKLKKKKGNNFLYSINAKKFNNNETQKLFNN